MDLESHEIQTSIVVTFGLTLITSFVPQLAHKLRSRRRRADNVFNVSDTNTSAVTTCVRHRKNCRSIESIVIQLVNFFTGGLLFALLALRLMPMIYKQFNIVYNNNNNTSLNTKSEVTAASIVNEDNVLVVNTETTSVSSNIESITSSLSVRTGLPYVELIVTAFFFVVYFIEQLIQSFTDWDGWHTKSSLVHLPALKSNGASTQVNKAESTNSVGAESTEPSLVACYRKKLEDEVVTTLAITNTNTSDQSSNSTTSDTVDSCLQSLPPKSQHHHKPDCPLAQQQQTSTMNRRLKIPCRPSHPSSIIIVLPKPEDNDMSTVWLKVKTGLAIISSVSVHQLTNGVTIGLQSGYWSWLALVVILFYTLLTSIMITRKLMRHCFDSYIMFLCQLIFSTLTPLGIIITSLIKISAFNELLMMGLSTGATFHLTFLALLQSERCTRLAGLIQFLAMYTGFTVVLCFVLLIGNSV